MTTIVLLTVIVAGTVAGLVWVPRLGTGTRISGGWLRHPGFWLSFVVALIFANQVLFTAYVAQRWDGDPSRIARYLPPGWFDLADLGAASDVLPAWPSSGICTTRARLSTSRFE